MRLSTIFGRNTKSNSTHTKYCAHSGCEERTREGKEFCSDHIENLDYVKKLMARIEEKEQEVKKVRKRGKRAVSAESENLKEIRQQLKFHGPRTKKRLQRELQLTSSGMEGFLDYMEEEDQIARGRTTRGDETIKLLEEK